MYVDPTGEFFWYAVAIGAVIGGVSNYADGGSFLAGAALGAVSGAISGGIGCGVQALGLSSTMTLMLSSTISGGITSVVFGGSLSDGLKAGAISGAVAGVVRFACLNTSITNPGVISAFTGAAGAAISDGDPLEAAVTGFISGAITAGVANRQAQQRAARTMSLLDYEMPTAEDNVPDSVIQKSISWQKTISALLDFKNLSPEDDVDDSIVLARSKAEAIKHTNAKYCQMMYSRKDQRIYLITSKEGYILDSWECRDKFEAGDDPTNGARASLPDGSYTSRVDLNPGPGGKYATGFGTFKILTDDWRGRVIHGGGTNQKLIPDPYADEQGWIGTYGCLRMQNGAGVELSKIIIAGGNRMLLNVSTSVVFSDKKVINYTQNGNQKVFQTIK